MAYQDMDATQPAGELWNGSLSVSSSAADGADEPRQSQQPTQEPETVEASLENADEEDAVGEAAVVAMLRAEDAAAVQKKRRKSVPPKSGNLRQMFASGAGTTPNTSQPICTSAILRHPAAAPVDPAAGAAPTAAASSTGGGGNVLSSAMQLPISKWQNDGMEVELLSAPPADHARSAQLEQSILSVPAPLAGPDEALPLLVASVPLLPAGGMIFQRLPSKWLDFTGRTDSLGLRCLFTSRRHENSVFQPLTSDQFLRVPPAAREWQPLMQMPEDPLSHAQLAEEDPWVLQCHPERRALRVLLRPGVLLMRMVRRGTALPSARFSWRISDGSAVGSRVEAPEAFPAMDAAVVVRPVAAAEPLGEFSILSNVEDAAYTQPPHFAEFPLRREQLRSLGWMVRQEKNRKEPFVTELREEATCPDASHWKLEGSLRCEYTDVRGGVLADAIGYGKTACTIGLVSCSFDDPMPTVPPAFKGMIPSRATLVLAPTNLHAQWVSEITKFTKDKLNVLSIPTCSQLKRLTIQDIMDADIVVATYRLFYSQAYLNRLQEIAKERHADFVFPRLPGSATAPGKSEWAKAYRKAFEVLPAWATALRGSEADPTTPDRPAQRKKKGDDITPTEVERPTVSTSSRRRKTKTADSESIATAVVEDEQATQPYVPESQSAEKRRRVSKKQPDIASQMLQSSQPSQPSVVAAAARAEWASTKKYPPLEAFWWRRVVCDEFHELMGRYPPAQVAVELFHADYKWGLSRTPPCQTLAQIRKAASFFGVQIPTASSNMDETAEVPRQVAQEWLDAFARRNTAELPPLEEEEKIVPVHLTAKERALYDGLANHHERIGDRVAYTQQADGVDLCDGSLVPVDDWKANTSTCSLLKLCSHFCYSGSSDVKTADDELDRQTGIRRRQLDAVSKDLTSFAGKAVELVEMVRHFNPHFCQQPAAEHYPYIAKEPKNAVVARLRYLGENGTIPGKKQDVAARLFELLSATGMREKAKDVVLCADFDGKTAGRAANLPKPDAPTWIGLELRSKAAIADDPVGSALHTARSKMGGSKSSTPSRCVRLRSTLGMPKVPKKEEDFKEFQQEDSEWRSDPDNAAKLRKVVDAWKVDIEKFSKSLLDLDAEARAKQGHYQSFVDTIEASQVAAAETQVIATEPLAICRKFAKYGSKIESIVKHVQRLHAQDATCKIICFVQWEDLKRKISSALLEFGVEHLTLQGSVWARRAALTKFQYDPEEDSPNLLLLSLQESASGTNLTAANHVIIVHPMEAATREEAVAFEMQAVGRVRRPGQQRKIHIWRFVTVDTIEQRITEEHQEELWERQRSRILVSQPDAATQSLMQGDSDEEAAGQPFPASEDLCTQAYAPPAANGMSFAPPSDPAMDSMLMPPPQLPPPFKKAKKAVAEPCPPAQLATEDAAFFEVDATQPFVPDVSAEGEDLDSSQTLQYEGGAGLAVESGSDPMAGQPAADDMATQGYWA